MSCYLSVHEHHVSVVQVAPHLLPRLHASAKPTPDTHMQGRHHMHPFLQGGCVFRYSLRVASLLPTGVRRRAARALRLASFMRLRSMRRPLASSMKLAPGYPEGPISTS